MKPEPDAEESKQDTGTVEPTTSTTYRIFATVAEIGIIRVTIGILAAGALVVGTLSIAGYLDGGVPRPVKVVGLATVLLLPFSDWAARQARSWLWNPDYVWLVDLDLLDLPGSGIYRWPMQRWREVRVTDGDLAWASPSLAFGKGVTRTKTGWEVSGTWRGTLDDRELMIALAKVEECRGQLEADAKRGFAIETQVFSIVRSAARNATLRVVSTFEKGSLPDRGESVGAAIDSAIESFGLEDRIRNLDAEEDAEEPVDLPDFSEVVNENGASPEAADD